MRTLLVFCNDQGGLWIPSNTVALKVQRKKKTTFTVRKNIEVFNISSVRNEKLVCQISQKNMFFHRPKIQDFLKNYLIFGNMNVHSRL